MKELIQNTWEKGIDADTRMRLLETGDEEYYDSEDMFVIKGEANIIDVMRRMISRSEYQIDCVIDSNLVNRFIGMFESMESESNRGGNTRAIDAGSRVRSVSEGPATAGDPKRRLHVSVFAPVYPDNIGAVKALQKFAYVRHIDRYPGVSMILVDNSELLIIHTKTDRPEQIAIWSNIPEYLDHYRYLMKSLLHDSIGVSSRMELLERTMKVDSIREEIVNLLVACGFVVTRQLRGRTGLNHEFYLVASHNKTGESIVIDASNSLDKQQVLLSLIQCAAKAIDVEATHKLFLSPIELSDQGIVRSYNNIVKIANIEEILQLIKSTILLI